MTTPSLPTLLAVRPFVRPVQGSVSIPGSKSLTNRAMLLAALGDGPVTLSGALFSEDTQIMAEGLRRLGFTVDENPERCEIRVVGRGGEIPASRADLFTGLAGTAARFLTALCAAAKRGTFRLDGVPQMRRRPMKGLIDVLRALGADIRCTGEEGFLPLEIRASGLQGGSVGIDASESSQLLSALLMVAPLAEKPVFAMPLNGLRMPFVRMTTRQMAQFGVNEIAREMEDGTIAIAPGQYHSPKTYVIEPDATGASYFAALPLVVGGSLTIEGLRSAEESLQGDVRFLDVLAHCGAHVARAEGGISVSLPKGGTRTGVSQDFSEFSDTFLTLAAIAPLLEGPTKIRGIAHTRKQETDRVYAMADELRRLGQDVFEAEDSLEIHPRVIRSGVTIEPRGDHRIAMSFAILASHDLRGDGSPWLAIGDPACSAKTFPSFFDVLCETRKKYSDLL